jgi:uncharacterized membrane protein YgcG
VVGKRPAKLAPPGEPREGKSAQLVNPDPQAHRIYGLAEDRVARSLRLMVFTLVLLIVGGLFLVGYGVWAFVEDRRGFRARHTPRRARHRHTDASSPSPTDPGSPLFWTTWGLDNTSSSSGSSSSADSSYDSGGGGSCDSGGSCSCDSGGGGGSSD